VPNTTILLYFFLLAILKLNGKIRAQGNEKQKNEKHYFLFLQLPILECRIGKTEIKGTTMQVYGAVSVGKFIYARRNDGREFLGMIDKVRSYPKGTLVTVCHGGEGSYFEYRNVYLEDCSEWKVYDNAEEFEAAVC
jgi:hypothetical protein